MTGLPPPAAARPVATGLRMAGAAGLALLLALPAFPAAAQNNTGYPSGTDCKGFSGERRAACLDAFDPRPNPREILPRPGSKPLLPPRPAPLGRDAMPTNPKSRQTVPPRMLRGQHK